MLRCHLIPQRIFLITLTYILDYYLLKIEFPEQPNIKIQMKISSIVPRFNDSNITTI